jgi:hypothetical protein
MNTGMKLSIVFLLIWGATLFSNVEVLTALLILNGFIQILLFILAASIPFLRTGRMQRWIVALQG